MAKLTPYGNDGMFASSPKTKLIEINVQISVTRQTDAGITAFFTNCSIRWFCRPCWFLFHDDCFTNR